MLCPTCHRRRTRDGACRHCGTAGLTLELVLPGGARVPAGDGLVIGRDPSAGVRLADPTVSRRHAVVRIVDGGPWLEDAASRHGTFVDGRRVVTRVRLRDGALIRCGDRELRAELPRRSGEAGATVMVRRDAAVDAPGAEFALKRLEAREGSKRWLIEGGPDGVQLRLGATDAELAAQLDGRRSLDELADDAEARYGPAGRMRLMRLLASLERHGMLGAQRPAPAPRRGGIVRRCLRPREVRIPRTARAVERLYAHGGWLLFTAPVLGLLATVLTAGLVAFAYAAFAGASTPLVVAGSVAPGAAVFAAGRAGIMVVHELAHALTLASFGRRVRSAGVRLVLIFPAAFVDTSTAWFEPRRARMQVSAAGPLSDMTLGGTFAIASLAAPGTLRAVCFQLALAAYAGALVNLNPCAERDGYHLLVDLLREPNLRARAREHLAGRLRGERRGGGPRALRAYSLATVAWSATTCGIVVAWSLRYAPQLAAAMPSGARWLVWPALALVWLACAAPLIVTFAPLLRRCRLRPRAWRPSRGTPTAT